MSFGIVSVGEGDGTARDDPVTRVAIFAVARDTYTFFFRNLWLIVRLAFVPIIAAGLVLYVSLNRYLADLLLFLENHNPRVASLALGTLAGGLFLSLFCYAIAVSAISDLALGKTAKGTMVALKATRQVWRIYAAYLRLLLLLSVVLVAACLASAYVAPLLPIYGAIGPWVLASASILAVVWLFARIGFMVAPVIAVSEGPVLRRAKEESARDLGRNCILILLLLVPGVLVLAAGGYVFGIESGSLWGGTLPLVDSTRAMSQTLGAVVTVVSLSLFVTIVLLTAGGIAAYQNKRFHEAVRSHPKQPIALNLGYSVPAEGPPK